MPQPDTKVEIALASDDKYFQGLLVTAVSMVEHASNDAILSFHILDGGISQANFTFFENRLSKLNPSVTINRIIVDESSLSQFPLYWSSKMTYARLLLPSLLPNVDFVIYSDVDFIWLTDICRLWKQCDDNFVLSSPREQMEDTLSIEEQWFADHHLKFNRKRYFCAGLAILNLRRFRKESFMMKVAEFLREHDDVRIADQTALNAVLLDYAALLDDEWHTLTASAQRDSLFRPTALHFAGDAPWKIDQLQDILSDTAMLWFRYYSHARYISTWKSLRTVLSPLKIIFKRLVFLVFASSQFSKYIFALVLKTIGRSDSIKYYVVRLRRVKIPNKAIPVNFTSFNGQDGKFCARNQGKKLDATD